MPIVNLSSYSYVPVLGTTEVDRMAYGQLRDATRVGILPLFELTRHRGGTDFTGSIELLSDIAHHPFLLDLDKRIAPPPYQSINPSNPIQEQQRVARETQENNAFNVYLNSLLSAGNGFENWRTITSQFPLGIPVLQFTNPIGQINAIIRQASLLSQGGNSIAMRIGESQSETLCQLASQILALLPNSSQMLLIFDCGQGRRGASDKAAWVRASLQSIVASLDVDQAANVRAVCMSNSYPQLQHEGIRIVENCDRDIWLEASETFNFVFGDYAASHRQSSLSAFLPRTYRATVVHSHDRRWITHRHENSDDPQGWQVGCAAIIATGEFDPIDSLTDNQIERVASNGLGSNDTPKPWHAMRISGHIERQFSYIEEYEDDL